jgi:hypothetical protein
VLLCLHLPSPSLLSSRALFSPDIPTYQALLPVLLIPCLGLLTFGIRLGLHGGGDAEPCLTDALAGRAIPPSTDPRLLLSSTRYPCLPMPQSFVDTLTNPNDDLLQELNVLDEDAASANVVDDNSGAVPIHAPLDLDPTLD